MSYAAIGLFAVAAVIYYIIYHGKEVKTASKSTEKEELI